MAYSRYERRFKTLEEANFYKNLRDNPPNHQRVDTPEMVAYGVGYNRPNESIPTRYSTMGNASSLGRDLLRAAWLAGVDNRVAERTGVKSLTLLKVKKKKHTRKTKRKFAFAEAEAYYKQLRAKPPKGDIAKLRIQNELMNAYGLGYQLPKEPLPMFILKGTLAYAAWAAGVDNRLGKEK